MSRFGNLEFGSESEEDFSGQAVLKDEAYYMQEATRAFEGGRFEKGLRAYAKVLEHNPKNPAAWTGQVRMLIELGECREAKLWADKALETFPREAELLAAKAVALARLGDLKAALAFSDSSVEEQGGTPYVWLARGDVLLARKEKRAEYCFDKALAASPCEWFLPWLASRAYLFYEQFARALKLAQQALERDASQAVIWFQLGRCQMALGLARQAQISLEHAQELDPESPGAEAALLELSRAGPWSKLASRMREFFRS